MQVPAAHLQQQGLQGCPLHSHGARDSTGHHVHHAAAGACASVPCCPGNPCTRAKRDSRPFVFADMAALVVRSESQLVAADRPLLQCTCSPRSSSHSTSQLTQLICRPRHAVLRPAQAAQRRPAASQHPLPAARRLGPVPCAQPQLAALRRPCRTCHHLWSLTGKASDTCLGSPW